MSVTVPLAGLRERAAAYGPHAYLVTVSDEGTPHVVSIAVAIEDDVVRAPAGRTSRTNAGARRTASLLWPAPLGEPYSLIVDGSATVDGEDVVLRPTRAVLHRVSGASDELPSCVTVI